MRNIVVFVLLCASLFANTLILDSNFSQIPLLQKTEFAKSELSATLQEAKQLNFLANSSTNFGVGNFAIWSKVKLCNNTPDIIDIYFTNLRAGVE